jgi:hypothetical protein
LPGCFLNNTLPQISFVDAINKIWPLISGFSSVYDLNATFFVYTGAVPNFYVTYDINSIIDKSFESKLLLKILDLTHTWIKVPKIYLAFNQVKNYTFYVAGKDLSKRNH